MSVPIKQAMAVGSYILRQRLAGKERYPLVMMLEPLFRCNLACAGCGKIQFPESILRKHLTPEQCFTAIDECGAPMVSIAGGEPLIHPQIQDIVAGMVARRKFVYLCTNALLLRRKLDLFTPSPYLTLSIHLDGVRCEHDAVVQRDGVYDTAVAAIRAAKERGFQITTNSTIFSDQSANTMHQFFDEMMALGINGMMISPGFSYEKAPVQDHFLKRESTKKLFREILAPMRKGTKHWRFNHSPFYLEFLEGKHDYRCTPWGNPCYNVFGWQRPCYLFSDAPYAKTFKQLMEDTNWDEYGTGHHPKCADCMAHCGYEPTAVTDSMSSLRNTWRSLAATVR